MTDFQKYNPRQVYIVSINTNLVNKTKTSSFSILYRGRRREKQREGEIERLTFNGG